MEAGSGPMFEELSLCIAFSMFGLCRRLLSPCVGPIALRTGRNFGLHVTISTPQQKKDCVAGTAHLSEFSENFWDSWSPHTHPLYTFGWESNFCPPGSGHLKFISQKSTDFVQICHPINGYARRIFSLASDSMWNAKLNMPINTKE